MWVGFDFSRFLGLRPKKCSYSPQIARQSAVLKRHRNQNNIMALDRWKFGEQCMKLALISQFTQNRKLIL